MKKVLLLSLFIALFAGCKKEEPYPKTDYFYGKWRCVISNFDLEFLSNGILNTIYRNQGPAGSKIDILGSGTWSYDEKSSNLKGVVKTWTNQSITQPLPGSPSIDGIVDRVESSVFYLTEAGSSIKLEKIP